MQKLKRLVMSCLAILAMPILAFSPMDYARSIEPKFGSWMTRIAV